MALRHWHPGKLVMSGVLCWLGAIVAVHFFDATISGDHLLPAFFLLLAVSLFLTPVAAVDIWFTARDKPLKHWHPGKLALYWVACWLGATPLVYLIHLLDAAPPRLLQDPIIVLIGMPLPILAVSLLLTPVIIAWQWFTGREKQYQQAP